MHARTKVSASECTEEHARGANIAWRKERKHTCIWLSAMVVYSRPPFVGSGWLRLMITLYNTDTFNPRTLPTTHHLVSMALQHIRTDDASTFRSHASSSLFFMDPCPPPKACFLTFSSCRALCHLTEAHTIFTLSIARQLLRPSLLARPIFFDPKQCLRHGGKGIWRYHDISLGVGPQ